MSKIYTGLVAFLLVVGSIKVGVAQQTQPLDRQNQNEVARSDGQAKFDRPMVEFFASKLVLCNNAAIQAGQMAAKKATNSEVKQFAEMLATDHAKFNARLKPFVASYGDQSIAATETTNTNNPLAIAGDKVRVDQDSSISKTQKETSLRVDAQTTLQSLYEVCEEAHKNHMAACTAMLTKKSGNEFDKAFVGAQIVGHMQLLAELKALDSRSGSDFQTVIREATKSVESHMQAAEGLCKTLEGQNERADTSNR